jgi:hypothetical protein
MADKQKHTTDWAPLPDDFMTEVAQTDKVVKSTRKSKDTPGDSDGDADDVDVQQAGTTSLAKHAPAGMGGGGGVSSVFGGTSGGAMASGAALGSQIGAEGAGPSIEAPHAVPGFAMRTATKLATPAPKQSSGGGGAGAGMGVGATAKSGVRCAECNSDDCKEHAVVKAEGGEGSRGGNVVGHTPSGRPVYESKRQFAEPHKDHDTGGTKGWGAIGEQDYHDHMAGYHTEEAAATKDAKLKRDHQDAAVSHKAAYTALGRAMKEPKSSGQTYRSTSDAEYMRSAMRNAKLASDKLLNTKKALKAGALAHSGSHATAGL